MLLRQAAAVVRRPLFRSLPCMSRSLHSVSVRQSQAFMDSALSNATQPMDAPKPLKEKPAYVDIETLGVDDGDSDYRLGQVNPLPDEQSFPQVVYTDTTVLDVLKQKSRYGNILHTVKENDSVSLAMEMMNTFNIGAILVCSATDADQVIGIISARDFIKGVTDDGVDPKGAPVSSFMSHQPVFTYSDSSALASMNMMNSGGFRHLPVRDRKTNQTIGLISLGDLVRTMLQQFKEKNSFLEDMVSGKYPA